MTPKTCSHCGAKLERKPGETNQRFAERITCGMRCWAMFKTEPITLRRCAAEVCNETIPRRGRAPAIYARIKYCTKHKWGRARKYPIVRNPDAMMKSL